MLPLDTSINNLEHEMINENNAKQPVSPTLLCFTDTKHSRCVWPHPKDHLCSITITRWHYNKELNIKIRSWTNFPLTKCEFQGSPSKPIKSVGSNHQVLGPLRFQHSPLIQVNLHTNYTCFLKLHSDHSHFLVNNQTLMQTVWILY